MRAVAGPQPLLLLAGFGANGRRQRSRPAPLSPHPPPASAPRLQRASRKLPSRVNSRPAPTGPTSLASGGCRCSRVVAAGPRSSGAAIGPGVGLWPPSRLGRCCWNWWKRLGSCPAGPARTFFFRRFLGAARGAAAGAGLQPDGAAVRGAGARHGPSPPRKCGRKRVGGSARGSGRRGKGGGAGLTIGRAPRKPSGARRPPRASSRCGTETTVMARRGLGLGRRREAGVTG